MLALFTICICSCKDDDNVETGAFDPSKPVAISDFTPKEGGAYQKLLIYGENFGTDVSKVKVKIGGKDAIVINVKVLMFTVLFLQELLVVKLKSL